MGGKGKWTQRGGRREGSPPGHMFPLGPVCFLQPQLGEDAHQHHDSHHPADDVDDKVGLVLGRVVQGVILTRWGLAGVKPEWRVVVGTGALVQSPLLKRAAEPEATSPAAEDEVARAAVERRVPLAHDIEVPPTGVRRGRSSRRCVRAPDALAGLSGGGPRAIAPCEQQHAAQLRQLPVPSSLLRPAHAGTQLGEEAAEEQPEDSAHRVSEPGLERSAAAGADATASGRAAEAAKAAGRGCGPPLAAHAGRRRGALGGRRPLRSAQTAFASSATRAEEGGRPGRSAPGPGGDGAGAGASAGCRSCGPPGEAGAESRGESLCP